MMSEKKISTIIELLHEEYGDVKSPLIHSNAFELLVAVLLSAQTTDNQVNKVTPSLFLVYPTPKDMAHANVSDIEKYINTVGLYKTKAKNISLLSKRLVDIYGGVVPNTIEDLITLAGIGRKSANVVLQHIFNNNVGVVVDTHIGRISVRLGLTQTQNSKDAKKIEQDLIKIIPEKDREKFGLYLIHHGRRVCTARKAFCDICKISSFCKSSKKLSEYVKS